MAKASIGLGSAANDGNGDDLRAAGGKINANFDEIYAAFGNGTVLDTVGGNIVGTTGAQTLTEKTLTAPLLTDPTVAAAIPALTLHDTAGPATTHSKVALQYNANEFRVQVRAADNTPLATLFNGTASAAGWDSLGVIAGTITLDGAVNVEGSLSVGGAGVVVSNPTGITGADAVTNIVSLTQAEYNAITPDASTFYVIVG